MVHGVVVLHRRYTDTRQFLPTAENILSWLVLCTIIHYLLLYWHNSHYSVVL